MFCVFPTWSVSGSVLSDPYLGPTWLLPGPSLAPSRPPTWSDWYFHGPYVFSNWSLSCLHMFCMIPTYSVSGPVLSGPYLATSWSLPRPFVDPTWSDCYQHGPHMVSILSIPWSFRYPYMFWVLTTWSLPGHGLTGPYLVVTWSPVGLFMVPVWSLCLPNLVCRVSTWSLRGSYTSCLFPTWSIPGPGYNLVHTLSIPGPFLVHFWSLHGPILVLLGPYMVPM